jgi:hypothetical protein
MLSAALGHLMSKQSSSIEKLIFPLEGICQHEPGLSSLSLGLKAQTGSGPGGADSGWNPLGIKKRPPAEIAGVSQDELLHVSRALPKPLLFPVFFQGSRNKPPCPNLAHEANQVLQLSWTSVYHSALSPPL